MPSHTTPPLVYDALDYWRDDESGFGICAVALEIVFPEIDRAKTYTLTFSTEPLPGAVKVKLVGDYALRVEDPHFFTRRGLEAREVAERELGLKRGDCFWVKLEEAT